MPACPKIFFLVGFEYVGYSFAYVCHFVFLGDVWIRNQRAAVASRCATNLATHLRFWFCHKGPEKINIFGFLLKYGKKLSFSYPKN
jgi:hypothetical protein